MTTATKNMWRTKVSRGDLISSLRNFYEREGHNPKQADTKTGRYATNGLYPTAAYKSLFGGWTLALEAAGLTPNVVRSSPSSSKNEISGTAIILATNDSGGESSVTIQKESLPEMVKLLMNGGYSKMEIEVA